MQPIKLVALVLPVLAMVSSCGPTLKVSSDYDRDVDFSGYKTYALSRDPDSLVSISRLNHDRILEAVKAEMAGKGFRETSADPDLLVDLVAIHRPRTADDIEHYKEGSLIIAVVDSKTKKLLWQAIGNSKIDCNDRDADQWIREAINKIMIAFPPGDPSKS